MNDNTFKKGLAVFFATFRNVKPDAESQKIWFTLLEDISDAEFLYVVTKICKEVRSFYPTDNFAALVREQLTANIDNEALMAWIAVKKAMGVHGSYKSVRFSDPIIHSVVKIMSYSWEEFCQKPLDTWMQKDFVNYYKAMLQRDKHPEYLVGIFGSKSPVFIETHTGKQKALPGHVSREEEQIKQLAKNVAERMKI